MEQYVILKQPSPHQVSFQNPRSWRITQLAVLWHHTVQLLPNAGVFL